MMRHEDRIRDCLAALCPGKQVELFAALGAAVKRHFPTAGSEPAPGPPRTPGAFTAADAILITYPDMLHAPGQIPLRVLGDFAKRRLDGIFSHIHVLPFFPSSSDEGFSVVDYRRVDPGLGDWGDLRALGKEHALVFDFVLNHASAQGDWFRGFLSGQQPYDRFFVTRPEGYDASAVFRPRTHPLLTRFRRGDGTDVRVWTTFSPDQADLDYADPRLLLEMLEVFLFYLAQGARILRLDAIAYVWKEDGTNCVDRPQAHTLVRLLRALLDLVRPGAALLSETNLPDAANLSYFGAGDEAQLVYNFALPPLMLHACLTERSDIFTAWAARQPRPRADRCLVNFLGSHDGIGVTPARGFLSDEDIALLAGAVKDRGGQVSSRSTPGGQVPYEINATFLDAVADPADPDERRSAIFLAAHAAMLAIAGVPAIYFHSLVGSGNWKSGPEQSGGSARSLNRERLSSIELERELDRGSGLRHTLYTGLTNLLRERARRPAFDPGSPQRPLEPDGSGRLLDPGIPAVPASRGSIFGLLRGEKTQTVLCLVNLSSAAGSCNLPAGFVPVGGDLDRGAPGGSAAPRLDGRSVGLPPWGFCWIDGSYEGD